jgi:ABC-type xylose transport system substrate-binding protein
MLVGCAPQAAAKPKIGLSFSDFATERWKNEADLMTKLFNEKGYDGIFWSRRLSKSQRKNGKR